MDDSASSVNRRVESTISVLHRDRDNQHRNEEEQANRGESETPAPEEVKDNLEDLAAAVSHANDYLGSRNSPCRLALSVDGGGIVLEITCTGRDGAGRKTVKRDITHEDFLRIVNHVAGGEGLLYDRTL